MDIFAQQIAININCIDSSNVMAMFAMAFEGKNSFLIKQPKKKINKSIYI